MEEKWWQNAVIYEIYCKSFYDSDGDGLGDLKGVLKKLPVLKELGVDCIWFTPIFKSPQVDNGYDVSDYTDIEPAYGNRKDFKAVVDKAHELGIKVISDMVLNHSSDKHPWFTMACKSKDNPYRDYYIWRDPKADGSEPNNWANCMADGTGSAWTFSPETGQYYFHNFSTHMPELNWKCQSLRQEIYKMMRDWLDFGLDGFRLDVIVKLVKPDDFPDAVGTPDANGFILDRMLSNNNPGIHEIIHELNENTFGIEKYNAFAIGECSVTYENGPQYIKPESKELDSLYHFQIVKRREKRIPWSEYKYIQDSWAKALKDGGMISQHLSNHDQARQVSRFGNDGAYRTLSAKALAIINHMMPGNPIIFQGEEIGMTNVSFPSIDDYNDKYTLGDYSLLVKGGTEPDEALRKLAPISRDNARTPYQWSADKNGGFTTGTPWIKVNPNYLSINYEADRKSPDSIFDFYKRLIAMRKTSPAMKNGELTIFDMDGEESVCFMRSTKDETLLILANVSDNEITPKLPDEIWEAKYEGVIGNYDDKGTLTKKNLRPWEAKVYRMI